MPVNLSIKNVPDWLVKRLKERAKRHHRSLQGELMAILEEALSPKRLTVEEAYRKIRALGLETGDESVALVREDRDGR
ncbi:FitA-like ribbon-helix-helix domain-containing protein [Candidatus Bipolaricaulota sp. J31]